MPCVANLNPRQSRRRLVLGLVTLAAAATGLVVLVRREEPVVWRAALFPVWWASMYGILQARRRT